VSLIKRLLGSGNRRGIISFSLAVFFFVINEALCKLVFGNIPTHQILAVRGLIATAIILAVVQASGAMPRIGRMFDRQVVLRSSVDLIGSYFYMVALFHIPLANMMAIHMSSPLMMTAVVAVLMRETVGWRRWSAVVAGFLGVLMVVQPNAGSFNAYSILAVGAAVCIVIRDLVTRRIDPGIPSSVIIFTNVGMMALTALVLALAEGWIGMSWRDLGFLAVAALCIAAGYQLAVDAFRHAEVPVIVPMRYTGLLWALLLGYLIWGDVPNTLASAGIVLIAGSGLYVLHRERLRGKQAAAKAAATPPP
jgi:drug/metabolite transporter (DMT)-like permease